MEFYVGQRVCWTEPDVPLFGGSLTKYGNVLSFDAKTVAVVLVVYGQTQIRFLSVEGTQWKQP